MKEQCPDQINHVEAIAKITNLIQPDDCSDLWAWYPWIDNIVETAALIETVDSYAELNNWLEKNVFPLLDNRQKIALAYAAGRFHRRLPNIRK